MKPDYNFDQLKVIIQQDWSLFPWIKWFHKELG